MKLKFGQIRDLYNNICIKIEEYEEAIKKLLDITGVDPNNKGIIEEAVAKESNEPVQMLINRLNTLYRDLSKIENSEFEAALGEDLLKYLDVPQH
ncbi:hypothetical protein [Clostridium thermarum]|uniref:hypothetical protein n=1 Tax=Clostridium thermarum TaxID=1716543 RepID=UPI001121F2D7|nr:hypothetical protein [Clostridium thermarum]